MIPDLLQRIVARKQEEVAASRKRLPQSRLCALLDGRRIKRPFFEKLRRAPTGAVNIIAEIKRASPSKGPLRPSLDPAAYAAAYTRGGAAAVSVLTDRTFFGGSPDDLSVARAATPLPVLRKDFIVSSYQLYHAAYLQADAVLLITAILEPPQLVAYLSLCAELQLDALVEVHDADELQTALRAGARLIGINNRDLRTFQTDIATSVRLAPLLGAEHTAVSESGVRNRQDIDTLHAAGIFNFLVGESLVRAPDPIAALRRLSASGEA